MSFSLIVDMYYLNTTPRHEFKLPNLLLKSIYMKQYYKSKKEKKEKSFQRSVKELIIVCALVIIMSIMLLTFIMF